MSGSAPLPLLSNVKDTTYRRERITILLFIVLRAATPVVAVKGQQRKKFAVIRDGIKQRPRDHDLMLTTSNILDMDQLRDVTPF